MTPKVRKTGKLALTLCAFGLALGAGALSAASSGVEKKSAMEIAFGVPITNGYYGSYETGSGSTQARVCRGFSKIMDGLRDNGYSGFSKISIGLHHIQMNAEKKGNAFSLRINKCTGTVTKRWET